MAEGVNNATGPATGTATAAVATLSSAPAALPAQVQTQPSGQQAPHEDFVQVKKTELAGPFKGSWHEVKRYANGMVEMERMAARAGFTIPELAALLTPPPADAGALPTPPPPPDQVPHLVAQTPGQDQPLTPATVKQMVAEALNEGQQRQQADAAARDEKVARAAERQAVEKAVTDLGLPPDHPHHDWFVAGLHTEINNVVLRANEHVLNSPLYTQEQKEEFWRKVVSRPATQEQLAEAMGTFSKKAVDLMNLAASRVASGQTKLPLATLGPGAPGGETTPDTRKMTPEQFAALPKAVKEAAVKRVMFGQATGPPGMRVPVQP